jgi:cyclopropane-fatty-acyl-phospholipid synthase
MAMTLGAAKPETREWPQRGYSARWLTTRLASAGITVNGDRPWDIRVRRERMAWRVFARGMLGACESYLDGDWDCDALDEATARVITSGLDDTLAHRPVALAHRIMAKLADLQSRAHAQANVVAHYDIGNDLYAEMLGRTMVYSCAYWRDAHTLDEAQDAKLALICHKLGLRPGMRVLDIGCGWGEFARHAAAGYGVSVTGLTLSPAQALLAQERCRRLPVQILERDYRDATGTFDRIVSIGMFEHVGPHNYDRFFDVARKRLKADGLMLLHTIGGLKSVAASDPWIDRYVFPGAVLPSAAEITAAIEGRFVLEDWHSFGPDYDRTLMAWYANFEAAWPTLSARYSERFRRLWRFYLLTCAGAFRARSNQLWQLVLSPHGARGGYQRVSS